MCAAAARARDVLVACKITDESGNEPIRAEMVWAWVPKRS